MKTTFIILFRLIVIIVFLSAIGYGLSGEWLFWKWHWVGIVLFFLCLIQTMVVALEDCGELPKFDDNEIVDDYD